MRSVRIWHSREKKQRRIHTHTRRPYTFHKNGIFALGSERLALSTILQSAAQSLASFLMEPDLSNKLVSVAPHWTNHPPNGVIESHSPLPLYLSDFHLV